jgi:hypothetical protein
VLTGITLLIPIYQPLNAEDSAGEEDKRGGEEEEEEEEARRTHHVTDLVSDASLYSKDPTGQRGGGVRGGDWGQNGGGGRWCEEEGDEDERAALCGEEGVDGGGRVRGGEVGAEGGQAQEERGEVVEALELVLLFLLLLSYVWCYW